MSNKRDVIKDKIIFLDFDGGMYWDHRRRGGAADRSAGCQR